MRSHRRPRHVIAPNDFRRVFAKGPSGKERDEKVLYLQRHHVTTAAPEFTVTIDGRPDEVGFDPYNKLIDRVSADNRKRVGYR